METNSVFEKIKELLDAQNITYEIVEHEPVFTSEEAAQIRDTNTSMGAKALVWMCDKKPLLLVVPGDKKVNFKHFKQEMGIKDMRMARPEEVKEITSLEIGSIPPVGKAMELQSYYDEIFTHMDSVAFNAGLHTVSIKMSAKDLIKVEQPVIISLV